jgi:lysyl-tRNA synthetase class 1
MSDTTLQPVKSSWAFVEAQKLVGHIEKKKKTAPVLFQTGFGPSGLPHIGTFAEVTRTTFVRQAFAALTGRLTALIAFSDDMDGLRKVPGNLPNQALLAQHLGKPLCHIPDPFASAASFSAHMNHQLIAFLEQYHLEHDFRSSHTQYAGGVFNEVLSRVLHHVEDIQGVILPTLKPANRPEWSPFMPLCEQCGRNLTTVVKTYDISRCEVEYVCRGGRHAALNGCGYHGKRSILNGGAKVGWKVDWALRWTAFDVDFEMYGKDLIESYASSNAICRILGGTPPQHYCYEMFLDEDGRKISKSVGKGLTIDEWITYAPLESLTYYLYSNPRKAKRLHFDVIPKQVDEYLQHLKHYAGLRTQEHRYESPIWYVHAQQSAPPAWEADVNFSLIQHLISAVGTDDEKLILEYISRYDHTVQAFSAVLLPMVRGCLRYYQDYILPHKQVSSPTAAEKEVLGALEGHLRGLPADVEAEDIHAVLYTVSSAYHLSPKALYQLLYRTLLGQDSGPRLGPLFKLVGLEEIRLRLGAVVHQNTL